MQKIIGFLHKSRVRILRDKVYRVRFFAVLYLFPIVAYGVILSTIKGTELSASSFIVDSFFFVEHYSLLIAFLATIIFLNKLVPKIISGFVYALVSIEMTFIVFFNAIYAYQLVLFLSGQSAVLIIGIVLAVKVRLFEKSLKIVLN